MTSIEKQTTISWLHLSDLHMGLDDDHQLWPNVRSLFFEDLEFICRHSGQWDLLFFTGDLTNTGDQREFERVTEFFDLLRTKIERFNPMPPVMVVPGNHDLARPGPTSPEVLAFRQWFAIPELRREFWQNPDSPYRKLVAKIFENYTSWWSHSGLRGPLSCLDGALPGDCFSTFEKDGVKVAIVGLNSAFLQMGKGDYIGRLCLSPRQFHQAGGGDGSKWLDLHDLSILLTHHPTNWMAPDALTDFNGEISPPGRFLIHLFGHMHEAMVRTESIGQGEVRRLWQGNSLFGLRTWGEEDVKLERNHGYSVGRLDIGGDQGLLTIWPRKLRRHVHGHWEFVPDHDAFTLRGEDNLSTSPESVAIRGKRNMPRDGRASLGWSSRQRMNVTRSVPDLVLKDDGGVQASALHPTWNEEPSFEASDVVEAARVVERHQRLLQALGREILDYLSSRPDPMRPVDLRTLIKALVALPSGVARNLSADQVARLIDNAQSYGFVPGLVTGAGGFSVPVDHIAPRLSRNTAAKDQIGATAADLIRTGMRVALDGGSTNFRIASRVIEHLDLGLLNNVTVLTNSLMVARRFLEWFDKRGWTDQSSPMRLMLCAGVIRATTRTLGEPAQDATEARDSLEALVRRLGGLDLCFIGVNGLTVEHGITMPTTVELGFKRLLLSASSHPYVVADATKFGLHFPVQIADWNSRLTVLTNRPETPSPELEAVLAMHRSVDIVFAASSTVEG
jgi:DeoR/GlpR family transcriptional regulator of sugar metabolism